MFTDCAERVARADRVSAEAGNATALRRRLSDDVSPHMNDLRWILLCAAVAMVTNACDGHMRTLYLRKRGVPGPPWYSFPTVIRVPRDTDVHACVGEVAAELKMQPDPTGGSSYRSHTEEGFSLLMSFEGNPDSGWTVRLLDWPTTSRSDLSRRAEHEIQVRCHGLTGQ